MIDYLVNLGLHSYTAEIILGSMFVICAGVVIGAFYRLIYRK
jgi:hypothetical protein